jgi:hypothetical protein
VAEQRVESLRSAITFSDELVLLDERDEAAECTAANIFFCAANLTSRSAPAPRPPESPNRFRLRPQLSSLLNLLFQRHHLFAVRERVNKPSENSAAPTIIKVDCVGSPLKTPL